ncbi:MAG: fasciclin domain-containing protein [Cyclobacteriaceae bacterium]
MKKTISTYFKAFFLVGAFASITVLTSCGDDNEVTEEPVTDSIMDLVNNTAGLDSLKKYLNVYPDLTALLDGDGTFTVFAPTNDAFIGLLQTPGFPAEITSINPDIIKGVLSYHVVSGQEVATADFEPSLTLNSLFTDPTTQTVQTITFNADGTLLTGSSNKELSVVTGDIAATNGVVHTVESVLIPLSVEATLTPILGTLAGSVLLGADFSILAEGIAKADAGKEAAATIAGALATVTDLTIFAPTNATFNGVGITVDTYDAATWDAIIRNHVVIGQGGGTDDGINTLGPDDLTTGSTYTTLQQGSLFFVEGTAMNGIGVFIDSNGDFDAGTGAGLNAEVALVDAVSISQGRIHVIAGVLSPN